MLTFLIPAKICADFLLDQWMGVSQPNAIYGLPYSLNCLSYLSPNKYPVKMLVKIKIQCRLFLPIRPKENIALFPAHRVTKINIYIYFGKCIEIDIVENFIFLGHNIGLIYAVDQFKTWNLRSYITMKKLVHATEGDSYNESCLLHQSLKNAHIVDCQGSTR